MRNEDLQELNALCTHIQPAAGGFSYADRFYPLQNENSSEEQLCHILYRHCYIQRSDLPQHSLPANDNLPAGHFMDMLSAVNHSSEISDPGWVVQKHLANNAMEVSKLGVTRIMQNRDGASPGTSVSFYRGKEDRYIQNGFYYVYSASLFMHDVPVARIYWNTSAQGALKLVEAVSTELNRYRLPFLFKCLSDPAAYTRRDSCVLYIGIAHLPLATPLLRNVHEHVRGFLHHETPLFTRKLQPGIALCESPANGNSFGISRMSIVARALLQAFKEQQKELPQRIQYIQQAFTTAGLQPGFPFLEAGTPSAGILNTYHL